MTCPNFETRPSIKANLKTSLMTTNSLILLSEFDAWEFPSLYQLDVPECSCIEEIWYINNLEPFEHLGLNHNELQDLEHLMTKVRTEELYAPVFSSPNGVFRRHHSLDGITMLLKSLTSCMTISLLIIVKGHNHTVMMKLN